MQTSRFETDVITATNNVIKTDFDKQALIELIQTKAVQEWYRVHFKEILDYVKALEKLN